MITVTPTTARTAPAAPPSLHNRDIGHLVKHNNERANNRVQERHVEKSNGLLHSLHCAYPSLLQIGKPSSLSMNSNWGACMITSWECSAASFSSSSSSFSLCPTGPGPASPGLLVRGACGLPFENHVLELVHPRLFFLLLFSPRGRGRLLAVPPPAAQEHRGPAPGQSARGRSDAPRCAAEPALAA